VLLDRGAVIDAASDHDRRGGCGRRRLVNDSRREIGECRDKLVRNLLRIIPAQANDSHQQRSELSPVELGDSPFAIRLAKVSDPAAAQPG
jgi:hypothetical protein